VGIGNRAMDMGMNSHCNFSTYMKLCTVICELGKHSHFNFALARYSPEHVIFTLSICTVTDWCAITVNHAYSNENHSTKPIKKFEILRF